MASTTQPQRVQLFARLIAVALGLLFLHFDEPS